MNLLDLHSTHGMESLYCRGWETIPLRCGVVWCGVVWCGALFSHRHHPIHSKRRDLALRCIALQCIALQCIAFAFALRWTWNGELGWLFVEKVAFGRTAMRVSDATESFDRSIDQSLTRPATSYWRLATNDWRLATSYWFRYSWSALTVLFVALAPPVLVESGSGSGSGCGSGWPSKR